MAGRLNCSVDVIPRGVQVASEIRFAEVRRQLRKACVGARPNPRISPRVQEARRFDLRRSGASW